MLKNEKQQKMPEKKLKQMLEKNWKNAEKQWHNTVPPQQVYWFRIIFWKTWHNTRSTH